MPVVALSSVTTRLSIPKQQQGSVSIPSPHSLSLSSPTTLQSRTDLNRLLDSVLDHATRMTDSQSPPTRDCPDNARSSLNSSMSNVVRPPPVRRLNSSKVRFYVESDDEDDDDTDNNEGVYETSIPLSIPPSSDTRSLDEDADGEESESDEKDNDYFGKRRQSTHHDRMTGGNSNPRFEPAAPVRRQSLLSDLLMAEKALAAQRASSNKHSSAYWSPTMFSSGASSRCHSAGNSDGESSYSNASPRPQLHTPKYTAPPTGIASNGPSFNQERASRGYMEDREPLTFPELDQGGEERCKVKSPLTRTKRVFRNLDDLAEQHRVSFLNNDDGHSLIRRSVPFRPRRPTIRPGDAGPPQLHDLILKTATLSSPIGPASIFSMAPASPTNINNHNHHNAPITLTAAESCRCKTSIVPLSPTNLNNVRDSSRLTLPTPSKTATGFTRPSHTISKNSQSNSNGQAGVVSLCDSTSGCCVPATVAATTTATSALATSATTTAAASPGSGLKVTATASARSAMGGMLRGWERAT
ncbi:hypothetical protein EMPS_04242 [Entomortierella parvispora]|uniref:Uncharacterized protein n=1 Tax=Entomortierella parvispora TaxID=205924 RepID=A0A9P3H8B8_9FUNG|nr:hypothetical protein EMPS_04242 [Entomortierella parvispora]